jgi:hypothetical protein
MRSIFFSTGADRIALERQRYFEESDNANRGIGQGCHIIRVVRGDLKRQAKILMSLRLIWIYPLTRRVWC